MFAVLINVGNEEGLLKPGMNVDAVFDVAEREAVLTLPVMALRAPRYRHDGGDPRRRCRAVAHRGRCAGRQQGRGTCTGAGERSGALGLGRGSGSSR
jgi:hypothetical protein